MSDSPVPLTLTDDERTFLMKGLLEWIGPVRPTDALAVAIGFQNVEDLQDQAMLMREALETNRPLPVSDWWLGGLQPITRRGDRGTRLTVLFRTSGALGQKW